MKTIFSVPVTPKEYLFLQAYFECMIWADGPEGNTFGFDDLCPDFGREQTIQALNFYLENKCFLTPKTIEQAGHDLWLTRCGHGAGFWDRGDLYVMSENGVNYADLLTERAEAYGEEYPEFIESSLIGKQTTVSYRSILLGGGKNDY